MPVYHALIGDILKSRLLEDRAARQRRLQSLLDKADQEFQTHVLSRFMFTGGDEFKALFSTGEGAFRCAVWLSLRSEVEIRFGLGRGALEVGIPGEPPGGLDGPCFHRARKAISYARRKGRWIVISGYQYPNRPSFDILINAALGLVGRVRQDWTAKQLQYISLLESGLTQTAVAKQIGVAPSTVNESLKASKWHEVREIEHEIAQQLDMIEDS